MSRITDLYAAANKNRLLMAILNSMAVAGGTAYLSNQSWTAEAIRSWISAAVAGGVVAFINFIRDPAKGNPAPAVTGEESK